MSNKAATTTREQGVEIPLPEVKMHIYRPNEPVVARIHKNEICTARKAAGFVRHVEFDISGTNLVGNITPGQSIGVIAPGKDEKGRPHAVRLYSVASPTRGEDGEGRIISTTVKRTIDEHWESHKLFLGVASNHLSDLHVGDEVRLSGPNGKRFLVPTDAGAHDYMFFATGTGIAPFRGMLLDLLAARVPSRIVLVMGSPYATDLLYHDFFLRAAAENPNFTYLTALSRQRQEPEPGSIGGSGSGGSVGHDPMYVQDRLTTDRDRLLPMLTSGRTLMYICGIAGMELGIFQHMARHLSPSALEQFLHVEPEAMGDHSGWTRKMLHKQIRPTRRVFLEVYA